MRLASPGPSPVLAPGCNLPLRASFAPRKPRRDRPRRRSSRAAPRTCPVISAHVRSVPAVERGWQTRQRRRGAELAQKQIARGSCTPRSQHDAVTSLKARGLNKSASFVLRARQRSSDSTDLHAIDRTLEIQALWHHAPSAGGPRVPLRNVCRATSHKTIANQITSVMRADHRSTDRRLNSVCTGAGRGRAATLSGSSPRERYKNK